MLPNVFGMRQEATLFTIFLRGGIGLAIVVAGFLIRQALIKRWLTSSTIVLANIHPYTVKQKRSLSIVKRGTIERTRHFAKVRFDAHGTPVRLRIKMSQWLYHEFMNRNSVRIRYANSDPRISLIEGEGFVFDSFPAEDGTP